MFSHSTVLDGPGPSSLCRRTSCFRARTAVFSSICSNWKGSEEEGDKCQKRNNESKCTYMAEDVLPLLSHTYLSQSRLLVPQADNEDAVSLADAALSPRGHAVVSLVQDNPIDVLLLGQPARQTVLVDTDGYRKKADMSISKRVLNH